MASNDLWQTINGALSIMGWCIVVMIAVYLGRNFKKTYDQPIRFVTIAFGAVILGHSLKDGSAYLMRCCGVVPSSRLLITAAVIIGAGKLGCLLIWSDPRWGPWPWLIAASLVALFLLGDRYL